MAFDRERLLAIGGFDAQFRQAGDDVDICWRFIDAGCRIGYAPAAVVWHHRRNTIRAYYRQQKGYGRAEAMLQFKHPQQFNAMSCLRWNGVIYGDGAAALAACSPVIYHGQFGEGLFQFLYHPKTYHAGIYFTCLEWHLLAAFFAVAALGYPAFASASLVMWSMTLWAGIRSARLAPLPDDAPLWCRGLVFCLHLMQPVTRGWHRYLYRINHKRRTWSTSPEVVDASLYVRHLSPQERDINWQSDYGLGREHLLDALVLAAYQKGWPGDFQNPWEGHDIELTGDLWHKILVRTATEDLGGSKRFTRVRCSLERTHLATLLGVGGLGIAFLAGVTMHPWLIMPVLSFLVILMIELIVSRDRCWRAVSALVLQAGRDAGLEPVACQPEQERAVAKAQGKRFRADAEKRT
jgi:hypothetical protein